MEGQIIHKMDAHKQMNQSVIFDIYIQKGYIITIEMEIKI